MVKTKETPKWRTTAAGGGKQLVTKPVPKPKWGVVNHMGVIQDKKQLQQLNIVVVQRSHAVTGQALGHLWTYVDIRN